MAKAPVTHSIRKAARYLDEKHGIDISELRMRALVTQNPIFVEDADTEKTTQGDSERQEWRVSERALDAYAKAVKAGTVRTASSGAKAYKVSADQAQLELLRQFCKANGMAEPVRANKAYTPKKGATASENGGEPAEVPSIEELAGEGDEAVGSDLFDVEA